MKKLARIQSAKGVGQLAGRLASLGAPGEGDDRRRRTKREAERRASCRGSGVAKKAQSMTIAEVPDAAIAMPTRSTRERRPSHAANIVAATSGRPSSTTSISWSRPTSRLKLIGRAGRRAACGGLSCPVPDPSREQPYPGVESLSQPAATGYPRSRAQLPPTNRPATRRRHVRPSSKRSCARFGPTRRRLERELETPGRELDRVKRSNSWRVTEPLRAAKAKLGTRR